MLKLEVGKTYVDSYGRKVLIVYKGKVGNYPYLGVSENSEIDYWYDEKGKRHNSLYHKELDLSKEYKEPVVHRRWVLWYKYKDQDIMQVSVYQSKQNLQASPWDYGFSVVSQQEIIYTEEEPKT